MRKVSEEPPRPFRLKRGHVFWEDVFGQRAMVLKRCCLGRRFWELGIGLYIQCIGMLFYTYGYVYILYSYIYIYIIRFSDV